LPAKCGPERKRDIGCLEAGSRNLVEERLERVMVISVDERHSHGRICQRARRSEPAKATAENDDMGTVSS
jgi:hypothetical protein